VEAALAEPRCFPLKKNHRTASPHPKTALQLRTIGMYSYSALFNSEAFQSPGVTLSERQSFRAVSGKEVRPRAWLLRSDLFMQLLVDLYKVRLIATLYRMANAIPISLFVLLESAPRLPSDAP
jgi:hypothetical protein